MKKLLLVLLMLPMLLLANGSTLDTAYVTRLDINTNYTNEAVGFDYAVWGSWSYDTTYDTNYWNELDTILNFVEDSIIWDGSVAGTLMVLPHIEVGRFNTFAIELFGDVDSLRVEYALAATVADFDRHDWDWEVDTTCTCTADSMYQHAVLNVPFNVWTKWRLIDIRGYARTLWFRFKEKEE